MTAGLPYWRLSNFYFFYFAILGALVPYWGPYLRGQGFSAAEIGELMAILHATRIVAPNLWGWLADRSGRRMFIVRLASAVALLTFLGVFLGSGYWWLAGVMALFSFFWNACLAQYEANTMNHLQGREQDYSRIRLWGSVGFIVAVIGVGELIDYFGEAVLPLTILLFFFALTVSSFLTPERRQERVSRAEPGFLKVALQPHVLGFLIVCFLLQASHGPYYAFYSIYLQDQGYSSVLVGALWAVGVVAEIGVFLLMHRLLPRFGARLLMTATLLLAALRWWLIGEFADLLPVLFGAQLLHAATYGVYHAVGIQLVNRYFVGPNQGRGQALYSSLTFGAGVAVGALISGYLWDVVGGETTFYAAAVLAAVTAIIAYTQIPGRRVGD
ncbi:MFS transporter [Alkalilimnicola ehrlichii]|uniref:MFS transporter n=1 Tax=Alkalilimnicola ehrlichii TaxID=351052 RepID=A0A3E0X2I4_9GAMM|nr:MFS transporter [Alkalilimnicola ehrlichii]RFA30901.1 MFS transporter [Alkalilimnicola ehrlichii]RFA38851.1 MFS transporter [Alkalilimnicola ehrlichii]